jgi:Protein of unknown function (DUF1217)
MSGSLSYLTSLFSSAFGAGDPLLNTLYGGGGQTPGSAGTPVQALQSAELNQTQDIKLTAAQPTVQHTITAFTQAVKGAKSVAQLLANHAVMKVLLTANGMGDQTGYTALVTKVLTSNLSDPNSLANTLSDSRWKTLAQTYDFATNGLKAIQDPKTLDTIANGYAQVTWQATQDSITPGLSSALAFKAKASTITSVDQILGDPIMRDVVTTALGVPEQIAFQTLNAQEQAIGSRIDLKQFQDPKFVETFVQRYLIANAANNTDSSSSTPDMITLAVQSRSNLF